MPHPAQSENAVTISEPIGYPKEGPGRPAGSQTPSYLTSQAATNYDAQESAQVQSCSVLAFRSVFNGLRAETGQRAKRFTGAAHYLWYGYRGTIVPARFGPNFVNIQPLGESVWSV